MKIAFFSDIHANLPALESVLEDLDTLQPDFVYCLGDLVGYNIWPNEVAHAIRARGIPTLAGNYDEGIGLNSDDCGCAYQSALEKAHGAVSISFTNQIVEEEVRAYLRMLPRHMSLQFQLNDERIHLLMVHGSPRRINEYLFEDRPDKSLSRILGAAGADIMLFGHTHKPFHRILKNEGEGETSYRHAINIGSVGKPKDGDPRACYVLLHLDPHFSLSQPDALRVEFRRVSYDVEKAAQAVENSPLPDYYAAALRQGK